MSMVRASKYRHVYGQPVKKDQCFDNIRLTKNAFDSNLAKSNGKYISLCWNASGGGAFAVLPVTKPGKLPDRFPLFSGHKGAVLDTEWNPFDDDMVVSASDDGSIGVWKVPAGFDPMTPAEDLDSVSDVEAVKFLTGHSKKVGHVLFNPVAKDILASSSLDHTIKIWSVESGDVLFTLEHPDVITSFAWNYDGTQIVSTCRDKKIRVWDVRKEKVLSEGQGHPGSKASRVVWLGDRNRVATTGFSRLSDRQLAIWDTENLDKGPIGDFKNLDQSSGIIMPFFDAGTSMLYLGGRGDGTIVYYEFVDDKLYDLFSYQSIAPQRGLAFVPDRALDIHDHEVARVYKVWETQIEPVPFRVPRKIEGFLSDIYKTCHSAVAALDADAWASGKTSRPLVSEWKDIYDGKKVDPKASAKEPAKEPAKETKAKETKAEPKETKAEESKVEDTKAKEPKETKETKTKESEETKELEATEVSALDKASKQDAYEVFQSKEVKTFLDKAGEEDLERPTVASREESVWDDEEESKPEEPKADTKEVKEPKDTEEAKAKPESEEPKDTEEPKDKSESEPKSSENGTAKALADLDAEANDVLDKASKAKAKLEEIKARNKKQAESTDIHAVVEKLSAVVDDLVARIERLESK
ncbi:Coronin-like protein [Wickerhamiella sorbophila]|uniref:Coronin n=1 Tax=Wickerhamiella sorbophila TaxID=45607 RepID=A0A2T0FH37_9ASCO|nr:Coronin-like protein [Wickerhamiella sorbophila]PRT54290.1 Coronin-like protein [Wickerhamiella sorbophila]